MYEVVTLDNTYSSEVINLWVKNKIFSEESAQKHVKNAVLGVKHLPTNSLISVSTAKLKYTLALSGYYYHYGVFSVPGHSSRPLLLNPTFTHMKLNKGNSVRGMVILVKNPRITIEILKRFGFNFPPNNFFAPPNFFYRNFT